MLTKTTKNLLKAFNDYNNLETTNCVAVFQCEFRYFV